MLSVNKSFIVLLPILILMAVFPLAKPTALEIREEKSPYFETFPMEIGSWQGKEIEPDEKTLEILETRNVLTREYRNEKGGFVHLLLVGSHKDRRVAHPPEVCYTGANYNIVKESDDVIEIRGSLIPVKEFSAEHERDPSRKEKVLYLYKVGSRYTINYYAQQFQFALDQISRKDSQVLLIRLAGTDPDHLRAFLADLVEFLPA